MKTERKLIKHIKNWTGNYQAIFEIENHKVADRRYKLPDAIDLRVETDLGTLFAHFDKGFEFDGRSGPKIVDWYAPNLGTVFERLAWLLHDGLGYATCLDFKSTNRFLSVWLRDEACYNRIKSSVIETAVSLSKSWYGYPDEKDTWYCNIGKFNLIWSNNENCK